MILCYTSLTSDMGVQVEDNMILCYTSLTSDMGVQLQVGGHDIMLYLSYF